MSSKFEREIEEILKEAEEVLPKDRSQRQEPKAAESVHPGPIHKLTGGRGLKISAGKLMLVSFALLVVAMILGATGIGYVLQLVIAGLVLFVIAYALFFVRPGTPRYQKKWRGRTVDEQDSLLERLRRWLRS